jgi:mannose-1-phosphate guanylyltransferase
MKIMSVILAGGAGTRLWPLSNDDKPKQFHKLTREGTLLEATIKRLTPIKPDLYIIAASGKYKKLCELEIAKTRINGIVLVEPEPKNTAPAILYSAIYLNELYKDSIMVVLPADHFINKKKLFSQVLKTAISEAEKDNLVTIGIKPEYPETGYGYIKAGKGKGNTFTVDKFVEKPDLKTAKKYVSDGSYFWNAGIFAWKTSAILNAFKDLLPDMYKAFFPMMQFGVKEISSDKGSMQTLKEEIFSSIKSVSIDYGIMEKAQNRKVISADLGWTDLGSWKAIDDILKPDRENNRCPENLKPVFVSSKNCSVFSECRNIALVGVDNLVVVESGDNILVMNKNNNQDVRTVVDLLKRKGKY